MGRHSYGEPEVIAYRGNNGRVIVGPFVSIAADVRFLVGGNHRTDIITTSPMHTLGVPPPEGHNSTRGDVTVGPDVWIGRGATIMAGVTIGAGAVIAACSVVVRDVPPYMIVGGNPAQSIRRRFSDRDCEKLLALAWWDWPDDQITAALPLLRSADIDALGRRGGMGRPVA
jgi:acetyltransferase-like isoleucine patch superfamily enzyme